MAPPIYAQTRRRSAAQRIKAMEDSYIPATINLTEPDPKCDLDYVANVGRAKQVRYAMSNSFAFGGLNAVIVLGPPPA